MMSEEKAWKALSNHNPLKALNLWHELIERETMEEKIEQYLSHSCYALIALNRYDEARNICLKLYEKYHDHVYAHQLCMVERECGNYDKAFEYLELEKSLIDSNNYLAIAANQYEFGKVHELLGNTSLALEYANSCMTFSRQCDDRVMHACSYRLLGDVYSNSAPDKALDYYMRAKEIFKEIGDQVGAEEIVDKIKGLKK